MFLNFDMTSSLLDSDMCIVLLPLGSLFHSVYLSCHEHDLIRCSALFFFGYRLQVLFFKEILIIILIDDNTYYYYNN